MRITEKEDKAGLEPTQRGRGEAPIATPPPAFAEQASALRSGGTRASKLLFLGAQTHTQAPVWMCTLRPRGSVVTLSSPREAAESAFLRFALSALLCSSFVFWRAFAHALYRVTEKEWVSERHGDARAPREAELKRNTHTRTHKQNARAHHTRGHSTPETSHTHTHYVARENERKQRRRKARDRCAAVQQLLPITTSVLHRRDVEQARANKTERAVTGAAPTCRHGHTAVVGEGG